MFVLNSIIETAEASSLTMESLLVCTLASVIFGFGVAGIYMYKNVYSKSFVATLVMLPAMVQIVIMIVNGNLGTGVAVMGAFSLVRFRSIPGSARDISSIFLAMAVGLATGMGYLTIALIFLVMMGLVTLMLNIMKFGEQKQVAADKELKITIPENLDYNGIFDDLFAKYTSKAELDRVKTTNMGSLYELKYLISLKEPEAEKQFIDEIRCRNGNLNIVCGRVPTRREEL
jgi:uncharacterized membrane protein YhiD involved in acid resistance